MTMFIKPVMITEPIVVFFPLTEPIPTFKEKIRTISIITRNRTKKNIPPTAEIKSERAIYYFSWLNYLKVCFIQDCFFQKIYKWN